MRLLFLQNTSILEGYGGIESYLDDLISQLTEMYGRGSMTAIVPRRSDSPGRALAYPVTQVAFRRRGLFGKLENRLSPAMIRAAIAATKSERPDALVSGHVSLGPLVHLVSRLAGVPYLSCAYGIECWGKLNVPEEHALKRSQRILSISHWTKKILVDRGYREEQIAIIHPRMPTALEKLPPPVSTPRGRRPFRLLTVSRLDAREAYKGQDHVIEAISRIRLTEPNLVIHYTILGKGTDEARLRDLVRHHGLESVVEFRPPFADREELAAAYRACDVYVMPSRFGRWGGRYRGEGFGIVYVEAAAFGVPSIAYACGGAMDIIHDGIDGYLITPDDIGELARRIAALAKDPRRVAELGQAAYASARKAFTRAGVRLEIETALAGLARPRAATPRDAGRMAADRR